MDNLIQLPSEKRPDKLDRYRSYLLDGKPLSDDQAKMLQRYQAAFSLLCNGHSRSQTVKMLQRSGLKETQAYQVTRDAILLFANVHETNKDGLRAIHYERLMAMSRKAEAEKDFKAAERCLAQATKLMNLFDQTSSSVDPKIFMIPMPVTFSSDPQVLKLQQQTEETDHEEV